MAGLIPRKLDLNNINSGQRYNDGDVVSADSINAPIEGTAYAQAFVESFATAPDNTEAGNVGTPTVEVVANGSYKKFKFKNLKGATGEKGTLWFIATGNLSIAPSGARIGDIVQNGGSGTYTIGGLSMAIGDFAQIASLSPLSLNASTKGNLRGAPGTGCLIVVNGVSQPQVNFSSDPQTQINTINSSLANLGKIKIDSTFYTARSTTNKSDGGLAGYITFII